MKRLFCYIVCFLLIFNSLATAGRAPSFPDDFEGKVTRQRAEEYAQNPESRPQFAQMLFMMYEVGDYLYQKYTLEELDDENFIENLRPFFPDESDDELESRRIFFRNAAAIYKKGKEAYIKFANKYLVPHTYRKVHDASEYDHAGEVPYIEPNPGEFVKVYNFKKFLTYSINEDERNAISDFERESAENDDVLVQIDRIAEKIEWKKMFLYGTKYKNPLFSELGVSAQQKGANVVARLIAREIYTQSQEEIDLGFHITTRRGYFVLANNLSPTLRKPELDASVSENVAEANLLYPMPQDAVILPQAHKYFGDFLLPLKIKPQDKNQPVNIHAKLSLTVCDTQLNCRPENLFFDLNLDVSGAEKFSNGYDSFFFQSLNRLPTDHVDVLKLKNFSVNQTADGQTLLLIFKTSKHVNSFNLYIEDNEGYTKFSHPRYMIRDNYIYAYVEALADEADNAPTDLRNTEYTISANLNNRFMYRTVLVPEEMSTQMPQTPVSKTKMWFLALLCGLMFCFIPCVFPLFALNIKALRFIMLKNPQQLKAATLSVVGGTVCGLVLLTALMFAGDKHNFFLYWGIQFGNAAGLTMLLFVAVSMLYLLAAVFNMLEDTVHKHPLLSCFILGILCLLSTTTCTVPWLSDVITYAEAENSTIRIGIVSALLLGFCLPYLLLMQPDTALWRLINKNIRLLPKLIIFFLYLALTWWLLLIWMQNGWLFAFCLMLALVVWGFICHIYQRFLNYTDGVFDESISLQQISKIVSGSCVFMSILFLVFCGTGVFQAHKHQLLRQQQKQESILHNIDFQFIENALKQNKPVLLSINASWCLRCRINSEFVLTKTSFKRLKTRFNLEVLNVENDKPTPEILAFMQKYGSKNLPFYILFTPLMKEGMVLPGWIQIEDINRILSHEFIM